MPVDLPHGAIGLVGRRLDDFEPILERQIDAPPRLMSPAAREVDELVACDCVQPRQKRPRRIPGIPLAVQADEYFLYQIFSFMRAESCASQAWRKRPTQRRRNFLEQVLIDDGIAAPPGTHGLCPALFTLFHGHLFAHAAPTPTNMVPVSAFAITTA